MQIELECKGFPTIFFFKSNSNEAGPSGIYNDVCFSTQSSDNDLNINDTDQVPNNGQSDATINDEIVELQNKTELDEEIIFRS
ncbi:hypothetical protein HF086_000380 [Spodoptera exigua]|uniref:Uncharacterized protein n=1 Tax=Spodoptera exigua TaxID=7107 RepID=A0A922SCX1_SPOEX|nr:hypothetical protein HF086_000380 [Spodoptera exigua]